MAATNPTVELYYSGAWHDITATNDVRTADPITITRGRPNESQVMPPSTLNLTIDNTDGKYSPRNPASPLYGLIGRNTPIRVSVPGSADYRFYGEVEAWPQRWNVKGSDVRTSITANGILRRLNAPGTTASALSALKRSILLALLVAGPPSYYWPLEDGSDAVAAVSGISDGPSLTPVNTDHVTFGSDGRAPGSAPMVSLEAFNDGSSAGDAGRFTEIPIPGLGSTGFSIALVFTADFASTPATTMRNLFRINLTGGNLQYVTLSAYAATSSGVPNGTYGMDVGTSSAALENNFATSPNPYDGKPHTLLVTFAQVGADVNATAYVDGVHFANDFGLQTGKTLGTPTTLLLNELQSVSFGGSDASNNTGTKVGIGHVTLWSGSASPFDLHDAMTGHAGETAAARIERLCTEEGISFTALGDPDTSELVGPQRIAPIVDLWNDAAKADGGILYESRNGFGMSYIVHTGLYNQSHIVDLDYAAGGEVAPPLEPVEDTDHIGNDITVTRLGGSSARVVQETGTLNVQEPTADPNGVGRYAKNLTLVLYQDSQALQQAAWLRHLGTWDEARYPVVNMDLTAMVADGKTALANDAAALDIGSRFSIINPPAWMPPDSIEQQAQGYVEVIESHRWTIAVNATPGRPYDVFQLETDVTHNLSRIPAATGKTTLSGSLTTTATSVGITSVTTPWIDSATYGTQFPFDIVVAGERMRVTACSGTGLTQTFTVTRSINRIVKTHAAGETVQLFRPPVIAR